MIFETVGEYYFWIGVQFGVKRLLLNIDKYLEDRFQFKNKTTDECIDSFKIGYSFGTILTSTEYKQITCPLIVPSKPKIRTLDKQLVGNC